MDQPREIMRYLKDIYTVTVGWFGAVGLAWQLYSFLVAFTVSQHATVFLSLVPEAFCNFPHSHCAFSRVSLHEQYPLIWKLGMLRF